MPDGAGQDRQGNRGDLAIGAGIILLSLALAWQASVIPGSASYAQVGADVFPWIVSAMLFMLGIFLTLAALRGGWSHEIEDAPESTDWRSLGWVALGLIINAAAIEYIGFILVSTVMFALIARGFGSTQPIRDAAIGFALALVSYVGFDRVLGYKIGSGLIESLI